MALLMSTSSTLYRMNSVLQQKQHETDHSDNSTTTTVTAQSCRNVTGTVNPGFAIVQLQSNTAKMEGLLLLLCGCISFICGIIVVATL